jgi:phage tail P2-like protein
MTSLLPPHESRRLRAISIAIREEFARVFSAIEAVKSIASPLLCPVSYLPAHKENLRPLIWSEDLTEHQKRRLLAAAPLIRLKAGSVGVVIAALESFGLNAHIERWDAFNGSPATFRVVIETVGSEYNDATIHRLERLINAAKRLSSHLVDIQAQASIDHLNIYIGGFSRSIEKIYLAEGE